MCSKTDIKLRDISLNDFRRLSVYYRLQGLSLPSRERELKQCHKTIGLKHKSHYAGALILYEYGKIAPHTNSLIQIAERLGMYEPSKLDESIECFHTQEDFVNHHSEN